MHRRSQGNVTQGGVRIGGLYIFLIKYGEEAKQSKKGFGASWGVGKFWEVTRAYVVDKSCLVRFVMQIRVLSGDKNFLLSSSFPGTRDRDTFRNGNLCYLYKGKFILCF